MNVVLWGGRKSSVGISIMLRLHVYMLRSRFPEVGGHRRTRARAMGLPVGAPAFCESL